MGMKTGSSMHVAGVLEKSHICFTVANVFKLSDVSEAHLTQTLHSFLTLAMPFSGPGFTESGLFWPHVQSPSHKSGILASLATPAL